MKFKVEASELSKCLSLVVNSVDKRTAIPGLGNIKITVAEGSLTCEATNMEMISRSECVPTVCEIPGSKTIPATKLAQYVGLLKGEVEFEVKREGSIQANCGNSKARFDTLSAESYYQLEFTKPVNLIAMPAVELKTMIDRVLPSVADKGDRHFLQGCRIRLRDGVLKMTTSDGNLLIETSCDYQQPGDVWFENRDAGFDVLMPDKLMEEYRKIYNLLKPQVVEIHSDEKMAVITIGSFIIAHRQRDNTRFIEYESVIPKQADTIATLDVKELLVAINRCKSLVDEPESKTKAIRFSISTDGVIISNTYGEESITCPVVGQNKEMLLPSEYLGEFLGVIKSEKVTIETNAGHKPVILRSADDARFFCLLQPLNG